METYSADDQAEESRSLCSPKSLAKLLTDMGPSLNGSPVSSGQASAGSTYPPGEASERLAEVDTPIFPSFEIQKLSMSPSGD